jgi:hypothetical protein
MRPEESNLAYLWDMREAAREVAVFVATVPFAQYQRDRMRRPVPHARGDEPSDSDGESEEAQPFPTRVGMNRAEHGRQVRYGPVLHPVGFQIITHNIYTRIKKLRGD